MKIAFKILPDSAQAGGNLLITGGAGLLSFVIYTPQPLEVQGLLVYHLDTDVKDGHLAMAIEKARREEPALEQAFAKVVFASDGNESVLVPQEYFDNEHTGSMLDTMFGPAPGEIIYFERLDAEGITNVHRMSKHITETLKSNFPEAEILHTSSLQLKDFAEKGTRLELIVYPATLKALLYRDGKLLLVQYLHYKTATDAAYHVLNALHQFQVDPAATQLRLSGLIDVQSNLYDELYKYFVDVQLDQPGNSSLAQGLQEYPSHFFSYLIQLASCVS